MHRIYILIFSLFFVALGVYAEEFDDITTWQESVVPPKFPQGPRSAWFFAANHSSVEWYVFSKNGKPSATNQVTVQANASGKPDFTPEAGRFRGASNFAEVDDGWLVGFNRGEFGAAIYWFSKDGTRNYPVSNHQVVDFFLLPDGVHAIEGLAHMGMSRGSVVRITRPHGNAPWQANTIVKLPFAPCAISLRKDGSMVITLSSSLVSIGPGHKIHTLLADLPWGGLYPNSSVLSFDEKKLFVGMRQFVGEFDFAATRLKFVLPSSRFLNVLPKEDEERMLRQYDE